jgi:diguanylate cyclase (GGDEF)-like protein
MLLAVLMLAAALAVAAVQRNADRTDQAARLANAAQQYATLLNNYFERARSSVLITSQNPEFAEFYEARGSRVAKVDAQIEELRRATRALAYLESLYPNSIGEACFIDRGGAENARVVRGQVAPIGDLSPDESGNPFFAPTFALDVGHVYQAEPYISPDTNEWVISNSTVVPTADGISHAIVHFEVTVDSFRLAAAEAVIDDDAILEVVDADTGQVVIDSRHPQEVGAPLGMPQDQTFGWTATADRRGSIQVQGRQASFVRIDASSGNANDWVVVATSQAVISVWDGAGAGTLGLTVAAFLLFAVGIWGFRQTQTELTKAALTDGLTGIGNRRALLGDLERAFADDDPELTLAMFDLDGFKAYNDTFGHLAGDALLARLARNLEGATKGRARAYRLGGDEFCLLTSVPDERRADLIADAMLALTERGDGFAVGASHGWVRRDEAESADEMLHLADKRMYAEKHGRRGPDTQGRDVLLATLQARYPELLEHADELVAVAGAISEELQLDPGAALQVRTAAELHDIGKVAIPESILRKPGPLTDDEWAFMQRHSEIGQRILGVSPTLASIGAILRAHHERWDGTGYPDGLRGEEIPLGARIIAVVDAYHAMILADRPHRDRSTPEQAMEELRRHAGTQFDPAVVEAFARSSARVASPTGPRM